MAATKYALGIDFGTESGRVMLVDADSGEEAAFHVVRYASGVIESKLPGGAALPPDFALQDPRDYLTVLREGIPAVLSGSGIDPWSVAGIGVDFTSCTVLPALAGGAPLCTRKEFASQPHAWVKLWKHHASQPQADRINQVAQERGEDFLDLYRGGYSAEWFFSKVLETLEAAPEVYAAADRFLEAGDWLVWQMTGEEKRSECAAGYKGMWVKGRGWPSEDFFAALHPNLRHVIAEKVRAPMAQLGGVHGQLTEEMAQQTGLVPGTPVAAFIIDAHSAVPGCGLTEPGRMAIIMGTSNCHMLLSEEKKLVEGMAGLVEDGILPGYWGYEAGQAAVGDIYGWFFRNGLPEEMSRAAAEAGVQPEHVLTARAASLKPGQSGLVALDWWNGCRSVLMDSGLSGVIAGLTLGSRPEEIYRALIEATAFGTRVILDEFENQGVPIRDIAACGGLAEKSPLVMQIFADVTGREILLPRSFQASGLGAAIHGAVASGYHPDFATAIARMARLQENSYRPDAAATAVYNTLYEEYRKLHDYFGRGANDVMKRLKAMRRAAAETD